MPLTHLPIPLLRTAIKIREKIDTLTSELMSLVGREDSSTPQKSSKARGGRKGKRTLSPEARAKIAAAQARRWAKVKGRSSAKPKAAAKAAKGKSGKRVLSPEARAKIAAAQKRRWAKARRG